MSKDDGKIKVGITHGDINGIGYEIIIKTFLDPQMMEICTPIVYGSSKVASYHRKTLNVNDFSFNLIKSAEAASSKRPNIINCTEKEIKIDIGKSTEVAGELSLIALEMAIEDLKKKNIDVLVTAPINKKNIQSKQFQFPGHTEYLAQKFQSENFLMLMVGGDLRIGTVTGHIPIKDVPGSITIEGIYKKIKIMNESLLKDFGIRKPRIAVLSLNPHAGDEGLIGKEEQEIIIPAITKAENDKYLVFGPYAADGFFGAQQSLKFDGVLAMYHDQGLIPFKTLSFDGVNFTAGLPIVRTSPAHGTAYDLAGKDQASYDAFRQSIYLACDIFKNRTSYNQLTKNPLKTTSAEQNPVESK